MIGYKEKTALFFVYFFIALCIGVFVRDMSTQPSLFLTLTNCMTLYGLGDPGSFATAGLDIHHYGWVTDQHVWIIHLWPPGFMMLEGYILDVFGTNAPFILILIVLNSLLFALLLLVFRECLSWVIPTKISSLLVLLPFLFPLTRFFLLEPAAIVYGEAFSIVFLLTAIFMLQIAAETSSWKKALIAGLMLALSAYFRSQFELIITVLTVMFLLIVICFFSIKMLGKINALNKDKLIKQLKMIALFLLATHLVLLPWRIHNYTESHSLSWVQTASLFYAAAGRTNEQFLESGAGWLVAGGANVACNVDPSYCGKSDKHQFYKTFMQHYSAWYRLKFKLVGKFWFSSTFSSLSAAPIRGNISPPRMDTAVNWLFLIAILITLPLLWLIRRTPNALIISWVTVSFYSCFLVIFTFAPFEYRYFYAVKIFSVFTVLQLICIAWSNFKRNTSPTNSKDLS